MKKLMLTLVFTTTIFTSCKKEDYSDREYYRVQYKTVNNLMTVDITASKAMNPTNVASPSFTNNSGSNVSFTAESNVNTNVIYKIDFAQGSVITIHYKKVDGSTLNMPLNKSENLLNTTF